MKYSAYMKMQAGEKLSRKEKKAILGKKMSKRELRKLLSSVEIIKHKYPESATILPYPFCLKCGCTEEIVVDHNVEWPEIWTECFCARCGSPTGGADNSPCYHVLEWVNK